VTDGALVSVIIAAFNAAASIEATLDSVMRQTYSPIEVLVADDASTDDTRERVLAFSRCHPNIQLLPAPVRGGRPAVPRNRALAAARGEYVAFLDADDLWTPRKLEDQVAAMAANPSLVFVYSIVRCFGPGARFFGSPFGLTPMPYLAALDAPSLARGNTVPLSSALARRNVILAVGGFDEDPKLQAVEDYALWVTLSRLGALGFIPRIHGFYRVHGAGISRDIGEQRRRAEYLVNKLQVREYTFRQFKQRSMAKSLVWNAFDTLVTLKLKIQEQFERATGTPVPVRSNSARLRSGKQAG
jgi:glycosyltransferase involved in cell wall biosynthesis